MAQSFSENHHCIDPMAHDLLTEISELAQINAVHINDICHGKTFSVQWYVTLQVFHRKLQ